MDFPWMISLCSGLHWQIMILDNAGGIVFLGEASSEEQLLTLVRLFTRNEEIKIDEKFERAKEKFSELKASVKKQYMIRAGMNLFNLYTRD